MNRRFFLKLFPVVSAAIALPADASLRLPSPALKIEPIAAKWQGDGYYEVKTGNDVCVLSVVRWSAFDHPADGRCFRFSPRVPFSGGEIVYRYEAWLDDVMITKVGEF
ncbi:hypothetical protein SD208_04895 [Ochrobactrum sp. BD67]